MVRQNGSECSLLGVSATIRSKFSKLELITVYQVQMHIIFVRLKNAKLL